jgi:hypothetical protein
LPGRTSPPPQVAPAQLTAPAPRVDPAALELALWQSADRSNDIADYEEYLQQYPQGQFAGIARNRVSKLRKDTANPVSQPEDFQFPTWHVHDNFLALQLGAGTITISPKDKTVNFQETGGDLNVKHNFSAPCSNIKTPKIAVKTEYNYSVQPVAKTDIVTLRLEVNGKGYNFMNGKTHDEQRGHALAIQEKIVKVCIYDKN